jgi:hypothetical protein
MHLDLLRLQNTCLLHNWWLPYWRGFLWRALLDVFESNAYVVPMQAIRAIALVHTILVLPHYVK